MKKTDSQFTNLGRIALLVLALVGFTAAFSDVGHVSRDKAEANDNLLGSYLAGRFARGQRDTSTAAEFYGRALAKDPKNEVILEQAFLLEASAGNWPRAVALAKDLIERDPANTVGRYQLGARAFKRGDYAAAKTHFSNVGKDPIADLTKILAHTWITHAEGRPDEALKTFDKMNKAEWSQHYQRYHRALIADLAGRKKEAGKDFARAFGKNPRSSRLAEAYARHAANDGNMELAKTILNTHLSKVSGGVIAKSLQEQFDRGETPDLLVRNPKEGLAEIFYGIGDALAGEDDYEIGTIYIQLALYLHPQFTVAHAALGEIYQSNKKYELAIKAYNQVPPDSPLWLNAQIRKAFAMNSLERVEEAKTLLEKLAEQRPKETKPLDALGDILRSHKRFDEAAVFYSRAIDLIDEPEKKDFSLFYARGVSYERLGQWPKAEADLQKAMELDSEQPLVLNYLGYSWVDQGRNLKEAMGLIRKAVKLDPNDGYFVDSLGWAHYRLGNFEKAAEHLERAVELRPDDPVINDHLGDAYWRVGRQFEAKYQWSQALTLKPEPEDKKKIENKLANGLEEPRRAEVRTGYQPVGEKAGN